MVHIQDLVGFMVANKMPTFARAKEQSGMIMTAHALGKSLPSMEALRCQCCKSHAGGRLLLLPRELPSSLQGRQSGVMGLAPGASPA